MFDGMITALVTPFGATPAKFPEIDFKAWEDLLEWQISAGVSGLVIYGTTGESATLSDEEKLELTRQAVKIVKKRVPIIAGTGTNDTRKSIELTRAVKELGVDAILAVSPYYNKPTQEGLFEHFQALGKDGGLPVIVYNIPGRAAVEISIETLERLSYLDTIVGVKQAVDSASVLIELAGRVSDRMDLFAGDDPLTFFVMAAGGKGVISASGSVIPEKMLAITENASRGKWDAARKAQQDILPMIKALFLETNPAPAKAALAMMGKIPSDSLRLPLVPIMPATRERLRKALGL